MPTILKEYPRVFTYENVKGQTYYRVDLRSKHYKGDKKTRDFSNEEDARKFHEEIKASVSRKGFDSITPMQSPRLDDLIKQCGLFGRTPEDAVKLACFHWLQEKEINISPKISELLPLYQTDKETGRKKLRGRSLATIKSFVNIFTQYFGDYRIKEVTDEMVDNYLKSRLTEDGNPIEPLTQKNHLRYLQGFFNWAIRKKHHNHNPATYWLKEIVVEQKTNDFYTIAQCEEILRRLLLPENEQMIGYYAICLFCGARPEETECLTWEANIKWDTKEIFIPSTIAKTKKDRQFVMSDTLYAWLKLVKDKGLPLIPEKNFRKLKDKAKEDISFEWINDGLRHTFATYHYAKYHNYHDLEHIMGNSKSVINNHYKGVISKTEIEKFFVLTPQELRGDYNTYYDTIH